jgi:hypothetical protein
MRLSSTLIVGCVSLLFACGGDDGSSGDDTSGGDDGSGSSTQGFPTSDDVSASSSGDDAPTTLDSESESGMPTTDPTDTSAGTDPDATGSDTGTGDVCEPADGDSDCYACQKENCCDAMTMCVDADPNCACVLDCLGEMEGAGPDEAMMCADQCGADFAPLTPSLMMLALCTQDMCGGGQQCGGGN